MNRGKKAVSTKVEGDIPDELRCKRSDGKQWRCNARAMENKTLCEKHYNQAKKRASGSGANASPKKKPKTKDEESLSLKSTTPVAEINNIVPSRDPEVRDRSANTHNSALYASDSSDYIYSNDSRQTTDYRFAGDFVDRSDHGRANDNRMHVNQPNGRQDIHSGSANNAEGCPTTHISLGNPYFEDVDMLDHCPVIMEEQGSICHQCGQDRKGQFMTCLVCGTCYCSNCIEMWYRYMHEDDVWHGCPLCRGVCSCQSCVCTDGSKSIFSNVGPVNDSQKVEYLKYMLKYIQPFLQQLHHDQCQEVDIEKNLHGEASTKPLRSRLKKDERLYCDNCNTAIIDLYRSCPACSYDLCLMCCRELRQGKQPGGVHSNSADDVSLVRIKSLVNETVSGNLCKLPSWHANDDNSIPCPPSERGGCAFSRLTLKRTLKSNWVAKLIAEVNHLLSEVQSSHLMDVMQQCSMCASKINADMVLTSSNYHNLRPASCRPDSYDNFLYCPTTQIIVREGLNHFQKHWVNGEPIIVRNVLDESKLRSWDPMVICDAVRASLQSKKIKALDCLDWCPVEISIKQFFKGYQEGRMHDNGWPEMLKLKDWHLPNFFEERLPQQGAQLIKSLPFQAYTNTRHGILNLASKIPDDCLKPDFGPRMYVAYGMREELGRGDCVTKLHYAICDTVNILAHIAEVKLTDWQSRRLNKYGKIFRKLVSRERVNGIYSQNQSFSSLGAHAYHIVLQSEDGSFDFSDISETSEASDEERVTTRISNGAKRVIEPNATTGIFAGSNYLPSQSSLLKGCTSVCEDDFIAVEQAFCSDDPVDQEDEIQQLHKLVFDDSSAGENEDLSQENGKFNVMTERQQGIHGGVLWDVFRRNDATKIQAYLERHVHEFTHINDKPVNNMIHSIHDQIFYLTDEHKKKLKDEFGVEPWTFEQHIGDAVFVPAGCPHQVRNLKSSITISLDFVSPESLHDSLRLTEELRLLPKEHFCKDDKFEVKKLALYAASRAVKDINFLTSAGSG